MIHHKSFKSDHLGQLCHCNIVNNTVRHLLILPLRHPYHMEFNSHFLANDCPVEYLIDLNYYDPINLVILIAHKYYLIHHHDFKSFCYFRVSVTKNHPLALHQLLIPRICLPVLNLIKWNDFIHSMIFHLAALRKALSFLMESGWENRGLRNPLPRSDVLSLASNEIAISTKYPWLLVELDVYVN